MAGPDSDDVNSVTGWSRQTWTFYQQHGMGSRVGFGKRPAVLVVDMSKAFTNPAYQVGCDQSATLQAISVLLQSARKAGLPVFYTTLAYEPGGADAGVWTEKLPSLLELDTSNRDAVEIDDHIAPQPADIVFNKKFPSAFFGTPLLSQLVAKGVDTLILTGCSTSGCIRATAIDGVSSGLRVIVPEECVGDRAEDPHFANLFDINAKYGDVIPLSEVVSHLDKSAADSRR